MGKGVTMEGVTMGGGVPMEGGTMGRKVSPWGEVSPWWVVDGG